MAFSYIEYTGNGSVTTFSIPFAYTAQADIAVYVGGVSATFSFTSTSTISLTTAPASGAVVRVARTTELGTRAVDFSNGAILTESDLDNSNIQVFYAAQEATDTANASISKSADGKFDAQSRVIKNLADPVSAQDAVTKTWAEAGMSSQLNIATTKASEASASATASANSASASQASAVLADADRVTTNADVVLTHADVVLTHADVVLAEADKVQTGLDRIASASSASSASSSASTATAQASTATAKASEASVSASSAAADVVLTHADVVLAEADKVQTGLDRSATNADVVLTHADVVLAEADKVQTGLDRTAAANSATASANSASAGANSATASATSATASASSASSASTSATTATTKASESATSATAAANSAASAAAAFDDFDDKYLGAKATEPTVNNDGDPLVTGNLYFLTGTGMQVWDGASWIAASSSGNVSMFAYEYTATAGQTTFSGSDINGQTLSYSSGNIHVTYGGLDIPVSDYTATNGTSIVLADGAEVGTIVRVTAFQSFVVADTYTQAQADVLLAAKAPIASPSFTGNVGIGTSVPNVALDVSRSGIGEVIEFTDGVSDTGHLGIVSGGGCSLWAGGFLTLGAGGGASNTERMRIDSGGNVHVAKTGWGGIGGTGFSAMSAGWIHAGSASTTTALLNRNGTDGTIVGLYKDGTTVGSIGSFSSSNFGITGSAANKGGLIFATSEVLPAKNGTYSSATVDLGNAGTLFKDLYLSGGVYLGGTGAANKLDDYEEGTWTPVYTGGTITMHTYRWGRYTKIGNSVTLNFYMVTSGSSSTGASVTITGLPFAAANNGTGGSKVPVTIAANNFPTKPIGGWIARGTSVIDLYKTETAANTFSIRTIDSDMQNSNGYNAIHGTVTYLV